MKLYICPVCGNVIELLEGNSKLIKCCNLEMEEIVPNTSGASVDKHMPIYEINGSNVIVKVGKDKHPMESDHHISWVALLHDNKFARVHLKDTKDTEVEFPYVKDSIIYAYCNIHGLWKIDVK